MIEANQDYRAKPRDESPNFEPLHLSDTELYMATNRHPKGRNSPEVRGGGFRDVRPIVTVAGGAEFDSGEADVPTQQRVKSRKGLKKLAALK